MQIGDKVKVSFEMEVSGIHRDHFDSKEIMVDGKIIGNTGHHYLSIPKNQCEKIEDTHAV